MKMMIATVCSVCCVYCIPYETLSAHAGELQGYFPLWTFLVHLTSLKPTTHMSNNNTISENYLVFWDQLCEHASPITHIR